MKAAIALTAGSSVSVAPSRASASASVRCIRRTKRYAVSVATTAPAEPVAELMTVACTPGSPSSRCAATPPANALARTTSSRSSASHDGFAARRAGSAASFVRARWP